MKQQQTKPKIDKMTDIPPPPPPIIEPGSQPGSPLQMQPGAPTSPGSTASTVIINNCDVKHKKSTMGTMGTNSEQIPTPIRQDTIYESDYSEMFPDIYPANHDHSKDLRAQLSPTSVSQVDSMATNFSTNSQKRKGNQSISQQTNITNNERRWSNQKQRYSKHRKSVKSRGRQGSKRNGYKTHLSAAPEEDISEFEEEEKQLIRKRGATTESVLDLQNSDHYDRAMRLKKATMSSVEQDDEEHRNGNNGHKHNVTNTTNTHGTTEDYVGTYSPPPPTLLSEAVDTIPPWELDDDDQGYGQPNGTEYKDHNYNHSSFGDQQEFDPTFPPPNTQYMTQEQFEQSVLSIEQDMQQQQQQHGHINHVSNETDEKVEVNNNDTKINGVHSKQQGSVVIKDDQEAYESVISSQIDPLPQRSENDNNDGHDDDDDNDNDYDDAFPPPNTQYMTQEQYEKSVIDLMGNDQNDDDNDDDRQGLDPIEVYQNEVYEMSIDKTVIIEPSKSHISVKSHKSLRSHKSHKSYQSIQSKTHHHNDTQTTKSIPKRDTSFKENNDAQSENELPYDEYHDVSDGNSGQHEDEHEMLEIRSQFTNQNSTKYVHPENDKFDNKISTLILSDDILNESEDEWGIGIEINGGRGNMDSYGDIPSQHTSIDVTQTRFTSQRTQSQSHPYKSASGAHSHTLTLTDPERGKNQSTSSLTPIPTDIQHQHQNQISSTSTPHSNLTRISNATPIEYEEPLKTLQQFRKIHEDSKNNSKHTTPADNVSLAYEEDGLSYYDDGGSLLSKPTFPGRDSQLTSDIADLNDESGLDELHEEDDSDYSDDSLRQLQVQYQRESQLKDNLKAALFNGGNLDDHDDPHPKDDPMNFSNTNTDGEADTNADFGSICIVKENEETDNDDLNLKQSHQSPLAKKLFVNQYSESSVHPRDVEETPYPHSISEKHGRVFREEDGYEIDSIYSDHRIDDNDNEYAKFKSQNNSNNSNNGKGHINHDYDGGEDEPDLGDSNEASFAMNNENSDNSLFNADIDIIVPVEYKKSLKPSVAKRISGNTPPASSGASLASYDNLRYNKSLSSYNNKSISFNKSISSTEPHHIRTDTPRNAAKRKSKSKSKRKRNSKKKSKRDSMFDDIAKDLNQQKNKEEIFNFDKLPRTKSIPYNTPSQLSQMDDIVKAEKKENNEKNASFELTHSQSEDEVIPLRLIQESNTTFNDGLSQRLQSLPDTDDDVDPGVAGTTNEFINNNDDNNSNNKGNNIHHEHMLSSSTVADMIVDIDYPTEHTDTSVHDIINSELNESDDISKLPNMMEMARHETDPFNEPETMQIDDIDEKLIPRAPRLDKERSKEELENAWNEARRKIKSPSAHDALINDEIENKSRESQEEDEDYLEIQNNNDNLPQESPRNPPQMSQHAIAELAKSLSSIHSAIDQEPDDIENDHDIFGDIPPIESDKDDEDDQYEMDQVTNLSKVDSLPRISATMKYTPTLQTGADKNKPYMGTPTPARKSQPDIASSIPPQELPPPAQTLSNELDKKVMKKTYNKPQPPPPPTPPNTTKRRTTVPKNVFWSPKSPQPTKKLPPTVSLDGDFKTLNNNDDDEKELMRKKKKKKKKRTAFMNLPPIPGVITLKRVVCTNLARGKMKASETYYLRVYQGDCEAIESSGRPSRPSIQNTNKIDPQQHKIEPNPPSVDSSTKRQIVAAKLKKIKSGKLIPSLPPNKKLGALPSLIVIKSYPVFAKQSQQSVTWQNLPASITKDAKMLKVGIYMKRERELVLIGSAPLAKSKKNLIPKPRVGVKNTTLTLTLNVPDKFSIWKGNSTMDINYTFCPRQFNVDIRVLQATKLPIYPSKIPVAIQLIRFHLLKISQEADMMSDDSDTESDSDSDQEYQSSNNNNNKIKNNNNRFYNQQRPSRNLINNLVGDMNSGHYKFDRVESVIVWHGLLRWFREMKPNALLHSNNINTEFITKHNQINDNDLRQKLLSILCEPYLSIFLWCIDFLIEISVWYHEKLNIDNAMIQSLVPNLFGFDQTQKQKLPINTFSFIVRILDLRKKQQFKIN